MENLNCDLHKERLLKSGYRAFTKTIIWEYGFIKMAVKTFQRNTPPSLLQIYDNRKHNIAMIFL